MAEVLKNDRLMKRSLMLVHTHLLIDETKRVISEDFGTYDSIAHSEKTAPHTASSSAP